MSLASPEIEAKVVAVLNDMVQDWDLELDDAIGPETLLMADLAFESIDVVQFAVKIEQAVDRKGLPFEQLFMQEGDYVDDLAVKQVVEFLQRELN